jgi:hypothetical protein
MDCTEGLDSGSNVGSRDGNVHIPSNKPCRASSRVRDQWCKQPVRLRKDECAWRGSRKKSPHRAMFTILVGNNRVSRALLAILAASGEPSREPPGPFHKSSDVVQSCPESSPWHRALGSPSRPAARASVPARIDPADETVFHHTPAGHRTAIDGTNRASGAHSSIGCFDAT